MYFTFLIPILLLVVLVLLVVFHRKKKKLIQKICRVSTCDKCRFLNELVEPLGYWYNLQQDVFTSTTDAWQKHYGYGENYDKLAPYGSMIFDCLPIYFDYGGKTWLIECWKGQYGINTGSELGVYCADGIVPPDKRKTTIFSAVPEEDYLDMRTELVRKRKPIASLCGAHWWLTIFSMGLFSQPDELSLHISIRFPDLEMRDAFLDALLCEGYDPESICTCYGTVIFCFRPPHRKRCCFEAIFRSYVQLKNRLFCRLYQFITRPFTNTCDKLLYLYFYLPFAFRHMLRLKRFGKRRHHRRCSRMPHGHKQKGA